MLEVAEIFVKGRDGGIPVVEALVVPSISSLLANQDVDLMILCKSSMTI